MPLQKFLFNPGINKEGTAYTAEGGWFDGYLVRFRKGLPENIENMSNCLNWILQKLDIPLLVKMMKEFIN